MSIALRASALRASRAASALTAFVLGASAVAQQDGAPAARGGYAAFSWFTILAVVLVVAALFVLLSPRRRKTGQTPPGGGSQR